MMNRKTEDRVRYAALMALELFALLTALVFYIEGEQGWGTAIASMAALLSPLVLEKLLGVRFQPAFVLWGYFYAVGMMLGHTYKLYYIFSWWDGMLHFFGGIAFAAVGWALPKRAGAVCGPRFTALFAVLFSMAVALGWEFIEFAADMLFGRDMQSDTYIYSITSFLLSQELGKMGSIENIESVVVNGTTVLPGLIDTGIIDTMSDTLVETLGAIFTAAALYFGGETILISENGND